MKKGADRLPSLGLQRLQQYYNDGCAQGFENARIPGLYPLFAFCRRPGADTRSRGRRQHPGAPTRLRCPPDQRHCRRCSEKDRERQAAYHEATRRMSATLRYWPKSMTLTQISWCSRETADQEGPLVPQETAAALKQTSALTTTVESRFFAVSSRFEHGEDPANGWIKTGTRFVCPLW